MSDSRSHGRLAAAVEDAKDVLDLLRSWQEQSRPFNEFVAELNVQQDETQKRDARGRDDT